MRVSITGIHFQYDEGFEVPYTHVELNYVSNGFIDSYNDPVTVTREEYEQERNNLNGLRRLIVAAKIEEAEQYLADLNAYREELQAGDE